jgi:isoprenylcysteine carboxyl methyltransferase (ICMT) family protein YpbQ
MIVTYIVSGLFLIRIITLFKSKKNEKKLKLNGAVEYGKLNSLLLTVFHILYYIVCLCEGYGNEINQYTYIGIGLWLFSYFILLIVIFSLKDIWTVKLIIAPKHKLVTSFLFRSFKHPNYFLNIIPELIAVALMCNSWYALCIGFPLYLIPLSIRIKQENRVMKEKFGIY